jgi:YbbR domain-containing protein
MIYHPFRHLGLKALSIALALLVWLSVSGEPIVERTMLVPLELQNVADNLELIDDPPASVDVRLRGGSGLLSHLAPGDVVAVLDLSGARPGRRFVALTPDRVRTPVGIEVTQVTPSTLALDIEASVTRSVKVDPQLEGQPAPGFEQAAVRCQPDAVDVVGPATFFTRHQVRVITEPIDISGAKGPVVETVALGVSSPGLRLKTPGRATITVVIRPVPVERALQSVAIQARNLAPRRAARVTPSAATITVKGAPAVLEGLSSEHFPAYVDLAGLAPGRYNLRVRVEPPPNVEIVQIQPASVGVSIK